IVSKASEDLPEPDRPVKTMSLSRGSSTVTFLRLCSRAPRMRIVSVDTETPRASERRECSSDPGRTHVRSEPAVSGADLHEGFPSYRRGQLDVLYVAHFSPAQTSDEPDGDVGYGRRGRLLARTDSADSREGPHQVGRAH